MGGGPPAGAQRVDVPDDNSVLPMPTNLRTAAVARWVGRGNGPSRVTGASACPAAGDCYKNNYPHNSRCSEDKHCTAGISHSTTNGATAHFPCQIRISSAKGGPGRDRMRKPSVTDAFRFTHGQTNSCTGSDVADMAVYGTLTFRPSYGRKVQEGEAVSVGRRQSAQTYWQQDDAQVATGPHNQFPWRIWRAAEALPSRQWSFSWVFFIDWSPPQRKKQLRHDLHAYLTVAQPRTQRIRHRHWSRGTVRTTFRHSCALHASLPGNHGYTPGNRREGRWKRSTSSYEGVGNQRGATAHLHKAQPRRQRLRHWSRGAVRTTCRHSFALHASLPVNRGYKPGNRNFIGAVSLPLFNRRQVLLSRAHIAASAPSGCRVLVSAAVRQGWGTTAHRWSAAELLVRGSVFYGPATGSQHIGARRTHLFTRFHIHLVTLTLTAAMDKICGLKPLSTIYTVVNAEGRLVL